jgi:uncharacterized protein (TIGR03086 family)
VTGQRLGASSTASTASVGGATIGEDPSAGPVRRQAGSVATVSTIDLPAAHRRALAATRVWVAGVGNDQWSGATGCDGWDVRALVNHLVAGNWWAGALARGGTIEGVGDRLDGDVLGDDPVAAYDASATDADAAFSAPGAMERPCAVSYGPVPGEIYCGHRFVDVLVHGWDLATATGQPADLDPELSAACLDVVRPQAELLTASGAFAPPLAVRHDAGAQTELLALLGRSG